MGLPPASPRCKKSQPQSEGTNSGTLPSLCPRITDKDTEDVMTSSCLSSTRGSSTSGLGKPFALSPLNHFEWLKKGAYIYCAPTMREAQGRCFSYLLNQVWNPIKIPRGGDRGGSQNQGCTEKFLNDRHTRTSISHELDCYSNFPSLITPNSESTTFWVRPSCPH